MIRESKENYKFTKFNKDKKKMDRSKKKTNKKYLH